MEPSSPESWSLTLADGAEGQRDSGAVCLWLLRSLSSSPVILSGRGCRLGPCTEEESDSGTGVVAGFELGALHCTTQAAPDHARTVLYLHRGESSTDEAGPGHQEHADICRETWVPNILFPKTSESSPRATKRGPWAERWKLGQCLLTPPPGPALRSLLQDPGMRFLGASS